jgi:hypothetical protein
MPARNQETRPISASFFSPRAGKQSRGKIEALPGSGGSGAARRGVRGESEPGRAAGDEATAAPGKERKGMFEEGFGFWCVGAWKAENRKSKEMSE